jgi:hypothetical protein
LVSSNASGDILLTEFQPAGSNVPYLNWLFDPAAGCSVENRALNRITSPQFDPVTCEIRSNWRDGATRCEVDVYVFGEGVPVLVRKDVKSINAQGPTPCKCRGLSAAFGRPSSSVKYGNFDLVSENNKALRIWDL